LTRIQIEPNSFKDMHSIPRSHLPGYGPNIRNKIKAMTCSIDINSLGAGVWHTHTLKSCLNHCLRATSQLYNLLADWARELFKHSKDVASLRLHFKKLESFGFQGFCGWHHKWGRFLAIL